MPFLGCHRSRRDARWGLGISRTALPSRPCGQPIDQLPLANQGRQLCAWVPDAEADPIAEALDTYLSGLAPHWRRVLGGYTLVDIAHKVVDVGSVGLRAILAHSGA
jgi:Uncharacterized protein conserved in bacteria (DUF2252)